jgi:asparagine synthetase B (glutamine-hydrolysing)
MIWYFDQRFLEDPDIQAVLGSYGFDHTNELLFANGVWNPGCSSIYNRKGAGNFLFKNGFREYDGFYMPDYNDDFKQDWNEVTDYRCDWLRQHRFDKPWTVAWSGGNDSTTVMSAIMKNLSKSDFENITVACNNASVWENPEFFQKYIEPNFKIVNSSYLMSQKCIDDENYVIDGNLADQLFAGSVSLEMSIQENALLGQDIRKNADDLINYIAQAKGDPIRCAAT